MNEASLKQADQTYFSTNINENITLLQKRLHINECFDLVYRSIIIGGQKSCFVFVDGFCKDELMEKFLQFLIEITPEAMPADPYAMLKTKMPYVEIDKTNSYETLETMVLSGVFALLIDGFDEAILIDSRTYPARDVAEPDKDKTLRGSRDGFVETLIFNTALIRRRIRSSELRMKLYTIGTISKTDVVVCFMENKVDQGFLHEIEQKLSDIQVEALSMNQESLAECLFEGKWYNPFPKFRYTERPDTTCAQLLEGSIAILVDNSPSVMLLPTSILDYLEEADDFYFPPVTGTYLRITRFLITIFAYLLTPLYTLFMLHPDWLPDALQFMQITDPINIPLIVQFLLMELAVDGLKLAAVNTPNMLSTPLSILAGLVLGEFSVKSGIFNTEVMLSMAFVAVANYTQSSYELGYAIKFMRLITLTLTYFFGLPGFLLGIFFTIFCIISNKTIGGRSYIAPIKSYSASQLFRRFIRYQKRE